MIFLMYVIIMCNNQQRSVENVGIADIVQKLFIINKYKLGYFC